jgi:signal transduction histidine kinase
MKPSTMRLAEFIEQEHDKIVDEWVAFAATLLPWAKDKDEQDLRDHISELLAAVVRDMKTPQTRHEQAEKSKGRSTTAEVVGDLSNTGKKHALERFQTGLKLDQLVAEYRAIRASVLRLWAKAHGDPQSDMTRFNEAIDEALTESTNWYSKELKYTRERFLAILGHDLRNPLYGIIMGAQLLTESQSSLSDRQLRVATVILNTAGRMERLVADLLDFTRTRLGAGIPITTKPMTLTPVCEQVISEFETTDPGHSSRFEAFGDLDGEWDHDRLEQVISNLVGNAMQYAGDDGRVRVVAHGQGDEVVLRVHNGGTPIPANALNWIFEPMVRQPTSDPTTNRTGLGLGLYIAREIVTAHGGTIRVTSTEQDGTTFTMKLPRYPRTAFNDL